MSHELINSTIKKNIYCIDKNEYGHVIILMKNIYPKKLSKFEIDYLLSHLISSINKSLEISKKYSKTTGYVHIYLSNCSLKNFSHSLFKRINKVLTDTFEDTLEYCYIYSKSKFFTILWNIIRSFIDPETREKIVHIKS